MTRLLDILFSFTALLVLLPLLLPVVLVLRFTGEGEVFYLQERVGRGRETISLFKFATMLKDSPKMGAGTITVKDDPRVLPFGSLLRKTKINELPQLFNVLKGDMSLIGPRPLTPETFGMYASEAQIEISKVRPGLSGIGSIVFRDEEAMLEGDDDPAAFYRENIAPHKARVELWYISNRSLGLYMKLIFMTVWAVIFPGSKAHEKLFTGMPKMPRNLEVNIERGDVAVRGK